MGLDGMYSPQCTDPVLAPITGKFCVRGFLKRNEPCMCERHMADCTTDWSCVCPGGRKVVCNGYTHTYTSSGFAHLSSLYSGRDYVEKVKGICLVPSASLPPAEGQTDQKHQ